MTLSCKTDRKGVSSPAMYYITTAIDYTNGTAPPSGTLMKKYLADVLARWRPE